ncbi:hypothetical protein AWC29_21170 [Mycobacterium triplex]|uniref:DUF4190 domain-containing protein n=1 Tax=Mycobacterium triplex TaxID=47839 RepID=A0A024JVX6_9MYCO|nr:DUF4190 domain-containing protein [Mycobacterium triplex]ORX02051.1 hypothetical protein AWC29_21170 [Mycobacterium triplex]CDO87761.1 hypothetical protein BN973_02117 [Mycobacterium triplex]
MNENQITTQAVQTNGLAIAAFVLSIMGMYASPILSSVLAVAGLWQIKHRSQQGFALAITALAVSAAVTALHVAMWIQCGHPNIELETTAHW